MTQEEIQIAESFRGFTSRQALASIYKIYDKYTGTKTTDCWCSALNRKIKAKQFYVWFDEQLENTNGSN